MKENPGCAVEATAHMAVMFLSDDNITATVRASILTVTHHLMPIYPCAGGPAHNKGGGPSNAYPIHPIHPSAGSPSHAYGHYSPQYWWLLHAPSLTHTYSCQC